MDVYAADGNNTHYNIEMQALPVTAIEKRARYYHGQVDAEEPSFLMEDGAHTIFLSTHGKNSKEVPQELVNFLKYVGAPLSESEKDFQDEFVTRFQKAVREVKVSREMGARYMTFQELLNDERAAGRAEGRAEGRTEAIREVIAKLFAVGNDAQEISKILQIPMEEIEAIAKE